MKSAIFLVKAGMDSCRDCEYVLEKFFDVDEEEVRKIIARLPDKTSPIHPFPPWLLERYVDAFFFLSLGLSLTILSDLVHFPVFVLFVKLL